MDYSLLIGLQEEPLDGNRTGQSCPPRDPALPAPVSTASPFTADDGGFRATFADNSPAPETYYLGIIDILTPYSLYKRLEHTFKSIVLPRDAISAVNPSMYARRFLKFMNRHILRDVNSSYCNKPLPEIPKSSWEGDA